MSEQKEKFSFEQNLEKLNELLKKMEEGALPLDELTKSYVDALGLLDALREQLDESKAQIQIVQQKRGYGQAN
ncbi:exodeoxyribonuclease VII small subunit [Psittacicella hinzii]|uniref:Exodeoxyribonuclease VII small subunit n=1 Tax=Psittacicella hinzii TaxID=2028575 RepID=A0A3A1Y2L4_9GAMM|nr:exodeoxyribonuclease VII small subunit [Psittacicella hinzii]RIY32552.1 exodeoxyribonuclease VII small subunit [Psittacicella hinzii]